MPEAGKQTLKFNNEGRILIKLHGFSVSNYCNVVRLALLEKGVAFEYAVTATSQEADFLAKSPMGKVPLLETEQGFLSETSVILDYIEDTQAGPAFYPQDPFERARVKQLVKILELYIELPARSCYPEAFFGGAVSDEVKAKARETLLKGTRAVQQLGSFSPFLAGSSVSYADFMFMYTIDLASVVAEKLLDLDLWAVMPEGSALLQKLNNGEHAMLVNRDRDADLAQFLAAKSA